MKELLSRRVFLVGGSGGVGKTTVAASLAVRLAEKGHRTIVLTVDPARRLAQALGLDGFSKELHQVPLEMGAPLYASMLDTRRYFDKIIEKFAQSGQQREKILNNPLYQVMVEHLGGTHEYAAMERLLEFANDKGYDKVVVDTPPTQNALDLLSAPQRLADFMDNSVLKYFQGKTPLYMKVFKQGSKLALKVLQMVLGSEFIDELQRFMNDLEGMQAGFRSRNLEVLKLLKSNQTAFCLVSYPTQVRYLEALGFEKALRESGISLAALILNQIEPDPGTEVTNSKSPLLRYYSALHTQQKPWLERLGTEFSGVPLFKVPKEAGSIHDVVTLSRLGSLLLN